MIERPTAEDLASFDAPVTEGRPAWWLDELASAGRENLDRDHVARFDDKEDAGAGAEVELLVGLGVGPDATVVDLGPGTGQFAAAMAPRCRRIVAVDVSPPMLERLRQRTAALGNVEVVHAGFLTYEHTGEPADVVYSRWALHHLPDFWKAVALRRMRQVLRPGGLLRLVDLVFGFDADAIEAGVERWCATLPVHAASDGEWARADIEEHLRDEHSTFTWLLEPMLSRAGFRIERAEYGGDGVSAAYVARAV